MLEDQTRKKKLDIHIYIYIHIIYTHQMIVFVVLDLTLWATIE